MTIYETRVQPVTLRNSALRGIPGTIAILALISLVVGVAEPTIRDTFPVALAISLALAVAFGLWAIRLYRQANRSLRVWRDGDGLSIRVGAFTLTHPTAQVGLFTRLLGRRSVRFAWIQLCDGERSLVVRKGLGALDRTPEWPERHFAPTPEEHYGDPQPLWQAFAQEQANREP